MKYLKVLCHGSPGGSTEFPGFRVSDPAMNTTTARVDPEQVLEVKILLEGRVKDLDGYRHEGPAPGADLGAGAATPHIVIIRHINIEH